MIEEFSAIPNGVTVDEVHEVEQVVLGPLLRAAKHNHDRGAPITWDDFEYCCRSAFTIGFGHGYRRARFDAHEEAHS